jgi:hypothetical protein
VVDVHSDHFILGCRHAISESKTVPFLNAHTYALWITKNQTPANLPKLKKMRSQYLPLFELAVSLLLLAGMSNASESLPHMQNTFPSKLLWGDTHIHTNLSFDANFSNGYRVGPEEAYKLARGELVQGNLGMPVQLAKPLDFVAIADHAVNMGLVQAVWDKSDLVQSQPDFNRWYQILQQARERDGDVIDLIIQASRPPAEVTPLQTEAVIADAWSQSIALADQFNVPGTFTALIAYEWTAMTSGNNLHRVVIFKDDAESAATIRPFSMQDSADPEALWAFMGDYESSTGGNVLAIPHNGNASNGMMFATKRADGGALDLDYATQRMRWEPLYEVTQIKGDAETHPLLSPEDPFANYETWDRGNIQGSTSKEYWMLEFEYGRSALKLGLQQKQQIGVNPFEVGFIGSSDSHTGMAAVREDNFMGKFGIDEPHAGRYSKIQQVGREAMPRSEYAAAGYAAVWAHENTRESIFEAMQRREVYATTGPRIAVRFFAGWGFDQVDHLKPNIAELGYTKGVPMGAQLPEGPSDVAPTFLVSAIKDPDGGNLERIQIIKGWIDSEGRTHEKVYDIALSDNRASNGEVIAPPIRSTVNIADASYENSVGEPLLSAVWSDPDFDQSESTFYYARVLEIWTPRWTTYDAAKFGTDLPGEVPVVHQERAYTSAIWYHGKSPES